MTRMAITLVHVHSNFTGDPELRHGIDALALDMLYETQQ